MDPITPEISTFSPWIPLGPSVLTFLAGGVITALVRGPGCLSLLAFGSNGMILISTFDEAAPGFGWEIWTNIFDERPPPPDAPPELAPAVLASAVSGVTSPNVGVAVVPRGPGTVDLVNLDASGSVWACRYALDHRDWPEDWHPISDGVKAAPGTIPTALMVGRDVELVFVIGSDGSAWLGRWDSSVGWEKWAPIGEAGILDPCRRQRVAVVAADEGRVDAFVIDRRGRLITTWMDEDSQSFQPWTPLSEEAMFAPQSQVTALLLDGGRVIVFAPANDRGVYTAARTGTVWGPWKRIGAAGLLAARPRIAVSAVRQGAEEIELFVTGHDGVVYESAGTVASGFRDWTALQGLSAPIPSRSILTAVSCRKGRTDLFVVQSDGVIQGASRGAAPRPPEAEAEPYFSRSEPPPAAWPPPLPPPPGPVDDSPLARFNRLRGLQTTADLRIKRYAIVIGIDEYADPDFKKLECCVNDVLALKDLLEGSGFEPVVALHDRAPELQYRPTRENIKVALITLCKKLTADDLVLVHFSCHGVLLHDKSYLVPSTARRILLDESALPVDEVMAILKNSKARRIVVLLDACHSGASRGRDISAPDPATAFARNVYERALGAKVLAAAGADQEAKERDDVARGVFTSFVIDALTKVDRYARADRERRGFVTFGDLRDYVCNGVIDFTQKHELETQFPNESGISDGDMMLVDFR